MSKRSIIGAAVILAAAIPSFGAVSVQYDLGAITGASTTYVGTGPAHLTTPSLGTTWNTTGSTQNTLSGNALASDGSAAGNLTLNFGTSALGDNNIDWAQNVTPSGHGGLTGFYNTDLMKDWVYTSGYQNLGVRLSGLPADTYQVYAIIREGNNLARTYDAFIGVNTTGIVKPSDLTVTKITGFTTADLAYSAWVAGQNFAVNNSVTTTSASDYITIIVQPTNAAYGTIQGFQIVSVPEPATLSVVGFAAVGFLARRRRTA